LASGQLRQRIVADGDGSASTCCVKLRTVDPMSAIFRSAASKYTGHKPNHNPVQQRAKQKRACHHDCKKVSHQDKAGGSSLFGTRRSTGRGSSVAHARLFAKACQAEIAWATTNRERRLAQPKHRADDRAYQARRSQRSTSATNGPHVAVNSWLISTTIYYRPV